MCQYSGMLFSFLMLPRILKTTNLAFRCCIKMETLQTLQLYRVKRKVKGRKKSTVGSPPGQLNFSPKDKEEVLDHAPSTAKSAILLVNVRGHKILSYLSLPC